MFEKIRDFFKKKLEMRRARRGLRKLDKLYGKNAEKDEAEFVGSEELKTRIAASGVEIMPDQEQLLDVLLTSPDAAPITVLTQPQGLGREYIRMTRGGLSTKKPLE